MIQYAACLILAAIAAGPAFAEAPKPDAATVAAIAPSGVLRAAINLGNPVLAQKDAKGELTGVSVALAKALGQTLGVPVKLIPYEEAGVTAAAGAKGEWDVAFLAIDPKRAEQIDFTAPYVVIDGTYMVPASSSFKTAADLDKDGVTISVATGAAYDLYLTRALKHATLVRAHNGAEAIALFEQDKVRATAGVGAALAVTAKGHAEWRVLSPGFQTIEQAMATPKGRPTALAYVGQYVQAQKASGFVRKALDETGQKDAAVAP